MKQNIRVKIPNAGTSHDIPARYVQIFICRICVDALAHFQQDAYLRLFGKRGKASGLICDEGSLCIQFFSDLAELEFHDTIQHCLSVSFVYLGRYRRWMVLVCLWFFFKFILLLDNTASLIQHITPCEHVQDANIFEVSSSTWNRSMKKIYAAYANLSTNPLFLAMQPPITKIELFCPHFTFFILYIQANNLMIFSENSIHTL